MAGTFHFQRYHLTGDSWPLVAAYLNGAPVYRRSQIERNEELMRNSRPAFQSPVEVVAASAATPAKKRHNEVRGSVLFCCLD